MNSKLLRRLSALSAATVFLLSACTPFQKASDTGDSSLTWGIRNGYIDFLTLAEETFRDIEMDYSAYAGANITAYEWAQMRGDDIPDIFVTSRILDEDLAKERLADLSGYDFADTISPAILEQSAMDGGVYLLPVSNTVHGIYYNKTLMGENNWDVPTNFAELESLCARIREKGMTPGLVGTELNDDPFSAVFNVAKTGWLSTQEGAEWEQQFLTGNASAAGMWEGTMDYIQRYMDIGMFSTDPGDRGNKELIEEEMGNRRIMFFTSMLDVSTAELPNGDQLGLMPYISEDSSKNIYISDPAGYIGLSKRLTEPGNEKKLENALRILTLLYSPEGQASFITNRTPCALSTLDSTDLPEDSLLHDALQAQSQGRFCPMTYTHWEHVLYDMGKLYKQWFRGEEGLDGPGCIAGMDEIRTSYLAHAETINYCESTADFTLEETAVLAGKALSSAAGTDAAMIPYAPFYKKGDLLGAGISGKLYKGMIDAEIITSISPGFDGEYAILTMTGAQAKELEETGFNLSGQGDPYPYILVTKDGKEPEDDQTCQVAFLMRSYTKDVGKKYNARTEQGSFQKFLREWLTEQQTVSPDRNEK